MPSSIQLRRVLIFSLVLVCLAVVVGACGGGESEPSGGDEPASATDINGTYEIVEDSDGQGPGEGVTVTLVLEDGTLTVHAVSADDELTDTGTYSIADGLMTIAFTEQEISATDQPYSLNGDTLEIPVKMFSDGAGSSTWTRVGGQAAAEPTAGEPSELESDWDDWDLDKDAAAAATKHFVEAVNDDGTEWTQAVTETAAFARGLDGVKDAEISDNGLNITILYEDGTGDYVVTERTTFESDSSVSRGEDTTQRLVALQPTTGDVPQTDKAATDNACVALPGSPSAARPPEPGREGLHPAGGYGVAIYDPNLQPKPIKSTDTPAKRALLVAPAYELAHPIRGAGGKVEVYESFKEAVGPTIECIETDLTGAGYTVDTILGQESGGKAVHTGDQAVEELGNLLAQNKYGAFYVMSHGSNITTWAGLVSESWMYMGFVDIERQEIKDAMDGRKLDKDVKTDVSIAIAKLAGLTWDGSGDAPLMIGSDFNGSGVVWVTPTFFKMLKSQRAVSFDQTLVFLNTCSSGRDTTLMDAIQPKAFFGWGAAMDGPFVSDTAETMFNSMADKARSARNAWWMWRRHEGWKIDKEGTARTENKDPEQLKAFGVGGMAYTPITSQTVLLIYRLRHGPSSASSDIAQSLVVVKSCSELFWSQGKRTGLASPACHQLELGNQLPTNEEVTDASFEVGGPEQQPFGRWTMAD